MPGLSVGCGLSAACLCFDDALAPVASALLSINSIGPQASSGAVPVDYTIDRDDATVAQLIALASTARPAAGLFGADSGDDPSDGTGTGYLDMGPVSMTMGGDAIEADLPDGMVSASRQIWYLPTGGGDGDVVGSGAFTADTKAPVLSSPGGAGSGAGGATALGVATDKGNGTLYWGLYPAASVPAAAAVIAGTGAAASGSQAVSGAGAQPVADQTGLAAETAYRAHYLHVDAVSNASALSTSAEFTTAAVSAGATATVLENLVMGTAFTSNAHSASLDLGAAEAGKRLLVLYAYGMQTPSDFGGAENDKSIAATLGGTGPVQLVVHDVQNRYSVAWIAVFDASAGGVQTFQAAPNDAVNASWRHWARRSFLVSGATGFAALPVAKDPNGDATMVLTDNCTEGDIIKTLLKLNDANGGSLTLTGLTADIDSGSTLGNRMAYFQSATAAATGSRTMVLQTAGMVDHKIATGVRVF